MKSQIKECLEADQAIFIVIGQAKAKERGAISILMDFLVREGLKKTFFFGTLSQTMGRWGAKVPNFLVKITI